MIAWRQPEAAPVCDRESRMRLRLNAGKMRQGLRSLWDLTQHHPTLADDSQAPPVALPRREAVFPRRSGSCQAQVRFFALRRIKPHAPLLVRAPVNSFEF